MDWRRDFVEDYFLAFMDYSMDYFKHTWGLLS